MGRSPNFPNKEDVRSPALNPFSGIRRRMTRSPLRWGRGS